jgi:hypothetical protein
MSSGFAPSKAMPEHREHQRQIFTAEESKSLFNWIAAPAKPTPDPGSIPGQALIWVRGWNDE